MGHITFIHGMLNKEPTEDLLKIWERSLERSAHPIYLKDEGFSTSMVYWADVLYEAPLSHDKEGSAEESTLTELDISGAEFAIDELAKQNTDEGTWLSSLEAKMRTQLEGVPNWTEEDALSQSKPDSLERIPLPSFAKDAFMKAFLRDVHHYLFNSTYSPRPGVTFQVQDEIRRRFLDDLEAAAAKNGPHFVISHSMGTVIAYDCLKRVPECPEVDAFITLGSPLGIDEIQEKLKPQWTRDNGFPEKVSMQKWFNFFDRIDVVSRLDAHLDEDFRAGGREIIRDKMQRHSGWWTHDITKYLQGEHVSRCINELVGALDPE